MDGLSSSPAVQVGFPLGMGVLAAMTPASARGVGGFLSTWGALQNAAQARRQAEAQGKREEFQNRLLALRELRESRPELQMIDDAPYWKNRTTQTLTPVQGEGFVPSPKAEDKRRLREVLAQPEFAVSELQPAPATLPVFAGPTGAPVPLTAPSPTLTAAPSTLTRASRLSALARQYPEFVAGAGMGPVVERAQKAQELALKEQEMVTTLKRWYGERLGNALEATYGEQLRSPQGTFERPTPAMLRTARKALIEEDLQKSREQGTAGAQLQVQVARDKMLAEEAQRAGKPAIDFTKMAGFIDRKTGQEVNRTITLDEAWSRARSGEIEPLDDKQYNEYSALQQVAPLVTRLYTQVADLYKPGGLFGQVKPGILNRIAAWGDAWYQRTSQESPELANALRDVQSNIDNIGRQLRGTVGVQTEQDAMRNLQSFAKMTGLPDTPRVAMESMVNTIKTLNGRASALVRNPAMTMVPVMTEADIALALRQGQGQVTRQQVLQAAQSRGYLVPPQ